MKTKRSILKKFSGTELVAGILAAILALSLTGASLAVAAPFAYVSNAADGSVSVIDVATNTVTATVPVGAWPSGVAVNSAGTRVYVTNRFGGTVSVIDVSTNAAQTLTGFDMPLGAAADGDRVYVADENGTLFVIDTNTNGVTSFRIGGMLNGVAVAGSRVYVTDASRGSVLVLNVADLTPSAPATIPVVSIPVGTEFASRPMGIVARASSSGERVYVVNLIDDVLERTLQLSVIDPSLIGSATNPVVDNVSIEWRVFSGEPAGIALSSDGSRLYVANSASNNVAVISTNPPALVTTVPVGARPHGVAVTGTLVYVANADAGSVSVIDSNMNAVVATVGVGGEPLAFGAFITPAVSQNPSPDPPSCEDKIITLQRKVATSKHYKHHHGYYKLKTALRLRAEATREIEKATAKVGAADVRIVKAKKEFGRGDEALCANRYWRAAHEYWEAYEIAHRVVKHYRYHRR